MALSNDQKTALNFKNFFDYIKAYFNQAYGSVEVPENVSDLNNDTGFITNTVNNLLNYYLKTETYSKTEINTLISNATSGGFIKVNELPSSDINIKAIYLVPYTGSKTKNLYEEYIYVDDDWEMIGTTKLDLSNYVTTTALNTALADYLTSTDINTLLADYVTASSLSTTLSGYPTTGTMNTALNGKQDKIQYSPMPTAGVEYVGQIFQYMGATNANYIHGYFYECTTDGTTYEWTQSNTQPNGGGYAPIGTIISYMGTTAPQDYLACDGSAKNIADYPQLANFFEAQFGSKNYFGGDGSTTFAVPNLQGEFLRGTGTNSHTNQGSSGDVGVHQDGTSFTAAFGYNNDQYVYVTDNDQAPYIDADVTTNTTKRVRLSGTRETGENLGSMLTSRPTNTSVLYCIKAVAAGDVYSTEERVVGTWIDGKPIYQKTIDFGALPNNSSKAVNHNISNLKKIIKLDGFATASDKVGIPLPYLNISVLGNGKNVYTTATAIVAETFVDSSAYYAYITIQYTKTTD